MLKNKTKIKPKKPPRTSFKYDVLKFCAIYSLELGICSPRIVIRYLSYHNSFPGTAIRSRDLHNSFPWTAIRSRDLYNFSSREWSRIAIRKNEFCKSRERIAVPENDETGFQIRSKGLRSSL